MKNGLRFPMKLGIAALVGAALGASIHWLVGAFVFVAIGCVLTLRQVRSEVIEMRISFSDFNEPAPKGARGTRSAPRQ